MRLTASDLSITVGQRSLYVGLSFEVHSGQCLAVTGPSGSGKSTLLAAVAGFVPLDAGSVTFDPQTETPSLQWVFQSTPLFVRRTVWENTLMAGRLQGLASDEVETRAAEVLDRLGLRSLSHTRVQRLSGGERQRVAIARTVVCRPDVVLADEPTASLDARSRSLVIEALRLLARAGSAVIVATHDQVVSAACDSNVALS